LDDLVVKAIVYLSNHDNVTKVVQTHQRSEANPDAKNEEVDLTSSRAINIAANTLVDFLAHVVNQKSLLSEAIAKAKAACGEDIDGAIIVNKTKQRVASALSSMASIKPSERVTQGRGFKFNVEGNQTSYVYDIKQVTTIDFDRNKVRKIAKKFMTESDETSRMLDKLMVDVNVVYDAPYDINDNFDDILEEFVAPKETAQK
jgi:hypothetical protein